MNLSHAEYLEQFKALQNEKVDLTTKKNADYAGEEDAFANFRLIEVLTKNRYAEMPCPHCNQTVRYSRQITTEDGILVRISDKLQRIANLLTRPNQVADESTTDTLKDQSIYSDIMNILLRNK